MPEYIPKAEILTDTIDLEDFIQGYLECAEWCGLDEEDRESFRETEFVRWSDEAYYGAFKDCADFVGSNMEDLHGLDCSKTGADFWLTRCGHGAGFWDRGLGARGERLTKAAHIYGERWVLFDPKTRTLNFG